MDRGAKSFLHHLDQRYIWACPNTSSCLFHLNQLLQNSSQSINLPNISFFRRIFASSVTPTMSSAAKAKAQEIIDNNAVGMCLGSLFPSQTRLLTCILCTAVFSKSYCPYCKASKELLREQNANFFVIEMDQVGTWVFLLYP